MPTREATETLESNSISDQVLIGNCKTTMAQAGLVEYTDRVGDAFSAMRILGTLALFKDRPDIPKIEITEFMGWLEVACKTCKVVGEKASFEQEGEDSYCFPCFEAFLVNRLPKLPSLSDEQLLAVADELLRLSGSQPIRESARCRDEAIGILGDFSRRAAA